MRIEIIKAALMTPTAGGRWGLPLIAWSEPGCAKSAVIELVGDDLGLPVQCLSPGTHGEGAFGCVPVPNAKGRLAYPAPEWVDAFEKAGNAGIVFVDEITTCPPALQPPLLGLALNKTIGFTYLGDRVRVIAAANPPEVAAGGYDLSPPVANRFGHVNWTPPTVDQHSAYMLGGKNQSGSNGHTKVDATKLEADVLAKWPEAFARATGLETAFLHRRPNLKNQCPKAGDPKASRAWPSDRSWEYAARAMASADVHGLNQTDSEVFVEAFIGTAAAGELFTYRDEADLPDPAKLLDGKVKWSPDKRRLDKTHAVLNACTALVTPKQAAKREDRTDALWGLLTKLSEDSSGHDILVPSMSALINADLHMRRTAGKALAAVAPVLEAAGVVK